MPGQFWIVWTATLVNRAGGFVGIFLTIYLTTERGFSETVAGLVLGLYGLGGAIGVTAAGHLTDRWGRRPTVLLAMGSASVLMVCLGLADSRPAIMIGALALGMAAEGARPPLGAMIADMVPAPDRGRAYSVYFWAINLGFATAAILAGFAAGSGYLTLFLADAATTAAAALLIAVKIRETRPALVEHPRQQRSGLATLARDRVFLGFVACNLLVALVLLQHMSMLPLAMIGDGLAPRTFGMVIALNGVLIVLGQPLVTRLLAGRREALVAPVSAVVIGVGFGLTAFAHTPVWYGATVLLWTAGEMLNAPSTAALLAGLSPVDMRGRYQGAYSLAWQAASFLAPTLGGAVTDLAGNSELWLGCLGLTLIAAVWNLVAVPARERRVAELTAAAEEQNELARI
ncbi:MFS transporter [Dactylosporangium sp. NBC_01737]|uniref:MDR family MFS transporter n=1 Tax=Dactylosporangium sp. NBC_01737 TaxID=2975959 RepID=UPI002E0D3330|nr:MFS transporter [Dactylosporangium sp. NBC_01737]